ncbi:5-formyltetrahydrofolate cyclo-ligase [Haloechinothrix halophila]|uniref:5-formyltetrahydrofolate cyclo-ligase n=1 Tax=Haloechinothrix halophila TaxID=1069073 RepID=UPI00041D924C|nr:5-formyltetrahydrofolate cyclo-ligase [Haloechinothrix halophila]
MTESDKTVGSGPDTTTKAAWRARLLAERDAVSAEDAGADAEALARAMANAVADLVKTAPGQSADAATVCCYVPFGSEPGSLAMVDALHGSGAEVLLPIVPDAPGPLNWARYDGPDTLRTGTLPGLLEPAGQRIGPAALGRASLVFVPALAIDYRGVRLGRGAGYYDRSLPLAAPSARLIAVVRDAELVPELPAEPHDVRLTGALLPERGLVSLPM